MIEERRGGWEGRVSDAPLKTRARERAFSLLLSLSTSYPLSPRMMTFSSERRRVDIVEEEREGVQGEREDGRRAGRREKKRVPTRTRFLSRLKLAFLPSGPRQPGRDLLSRTAHTTHPRTPHTHTHTHTHTRTQWSPLPHPRSPHSPTRSAPPARRPPAAPRPATRGARRASPPPRSTWPHLARPASGRSTCRSCEEEGRGGVEGTGPARRDIRGEVPPLRARGPRSKNWLLAGGRETRRASAIRARHCPDSHPHALSIS